MGRMGEKRDPESEQEPGQARIRGRDSQRYTQQSAWGEKRERQKEERHREAETQRGSPRDDRKYGETGHSGAGRHRQTEGQAQKDRDGNIED